MNKKLIILAGVLTIALSGCEHWSDPYRPLHRSGTHCYKITAALHASNQLNPVKKARLMRESEVYDCDNGPYEN